MKNDEERTLEEVNRILATSDVPELESIPGFNSFKKSWNTSIQYDADLGLLSNTLVEFISNALIEANTRKIKEKLKKPLVEWERYQVLHKKFFGDRMNTVSDVSKDAT